MVMTTGWVSLQTLHKNKQTNKQTKKTEYTFLSTVRGIFSRTDHILGHKTSLHKFKSIELISSIFSDHSCMKLEINNRKRNDKKTNYMESKQHATKKRVDQQCEIKEKILKIP